jgi:Asp-tRNA(Asn)/Glu-tRNA(Gln) amidotransferase C subunit
LNAAPPNDSFCFDPAGASDVLREDIPIVDSTVEEMLGSMNTYEGFIRGPKVV